MSDFDPYSYHEVIDRTHVVISIIEDHIRSHPIVERNSKFLALAEGAQDMLAELYQKVSIEDDNKHGD